MLFFSLLPFIAGVVSVLLSFVVLISGKRSLSSFAFVIFSLSMGAWAILISAFLLSVDNGMAWWFAASYYVAALLLVYGFLLYCFSINARFDTRVRVILGVVSALPIVILSGTVLLTDNIITSVAIANSNEVQLDSVGYFIYCVIFSAYAITSLLMMRASVASEVSPRRRAQNKIIAKAMYISLPAGALFNLILPLLGNYDLIMVGPVFTLPIVGSVFLAIMRHRLFSIRQAVVRTVTYFMLLTTIILLYFGLATILAHLIDGEIATSGEVIGNLSVALILALAFQPLKRFFDRLTNKLFYRDIYNSDVFFSNLNKELSTPSDLRDLLRRAATVIQTAIKTEQAFFFVWYDDHRHMTAGTKGHQIIAVGDVKRLDEYVTEYGDMPLLVESMADENPLRRVLMRHEVALILPLMRDKQIISYAFLGEQRNGSYSRRDMRVLKTVADGLVVAIQNALSIQNIQEINETLQQRIDDATKELRQSNEKLQRLDAAKDEFVSMASHQLRTPLTSVKGYISMVLEGDAGKVNEMQTQLLQEAFTSSERMVHLINDFLNVSRLQTGKFMIDKRPIDLSRVMKQEVDSLQSTADAHNLKLTYRQPSRFPVLYIDEGKIRQVIMNFIDNAIYYSRESTTIKVELSIIEGDAVVQIHDTGIGVPLAEQKHLFTKFFRASNARKQRPDGTGVGLFLAKKVIVAHGGSILFESHEGNGSTFGFRLPIRKLSSAPKDDAN